MDSSTEKKQKEWHFLTSFGFSLISLFIGLLVMFINHFFLVTDTSNTFNFFLVKKHESPSGLTEKTSDSNINKSTEIYLDPLLQVLKHHWDAVFNEEDWHNTGRPDEMLTRYKIFLQDNGKSLSNEQSDSLKEFFMNYEKFLMSQHQPAKEREKELKDLNKKWKNSWSYKLEAIFSEEIKPISIIVVYGAVFALIVTIFVYLFVRKQLLSLADHLTYWGTAIALWGIVITILK